MAYKVKLSRQDRTFYIIVYCIVTFLTLTVLYPVIFVISSSFSSGAAVSTGQVVFLPVDFSLEGYRRVMEYREVWLGYRNTIFYTVVGTVNNVAMTMICAYPMSRKDLPGKKYLTWFFLVSMYFGGGLIPTYLLMRDIGYLNTVWAIIVPGSFSVYQMIVARTFINNNVPHEMLEAAKIDGCSDFRYFLMFVLPLSKAILAVLTLQYAVGHWNSYFSAHIYLTKKELYPLQSFLREILVMSNINVDEQLDPETADIIRGLAEAMKYALIVVATAPIMCVYPFIQKYFVQGIIIGSLKG
ncbi:MAG: carbohydrate ABC transporter permease [Eubacteriales bacterium]|nr:carbohydrate ABC transporter permease [Eubacteriales bacterium]